jgi:hypothetical protein
VKVRLPGLAQGELKLRRRGGHFSSIHEQGILLSHPALARFSTATPTVLVLRVADDAVTGWVGLGAPGPVKGSRRSLFDAMTKASDLLGWAGLSAITIPTFHNKFEAGVIDVGAEKLVFTVGGFLSATGSAALDNKGLSFDGSAKVQIPGGASSELQIKKDPTGALSGSLVMQVSIGRVAGNVTATLTNGFVSIMGGVAYSDDRMSGKVTLVATDEATARDITLKKPAAGADVPIELPGPDKPVKPGKRAYCGWGQLTFRVNEWLAGTATVIVNSKGQATIIGEIAPPKEFLLFPKKDWPDKKIFKLEIRATYGIPVVGEVGLFANIGLYALATIGPGLLKDLKMSGAYSTDPRVPKALTLEGTINISAFAGLRLTAQAGLVVTILSHDIKAGVELAALAGVRGYVQATPRIGMREPTPGQRQYFIQGHLEIAAQPVLGFSGDLFVELDTPWWSPLSDKRWTWPLFSIEYPLPGEFGIGADVDYVLGSKKWPEIAFGEVDFDGSKFLTDVMNDNTDKGRGGEVKKQGEWREGVGGGGPGGARNKGGSGKVPQGEQDDIGPIGDDLSFSDGTESHRLWIEEKDADAKVMVASKEARVADDAAQLQRWVPELPASDQGRARTLIRLVTAGATTVDGPATDLAHKKEAARNIKKAAARNKGKARKKTGQRAKKDIKQEQKQVRAAEHALLTPEQELKRLLARVPFRPVPGNVPMTGGSQALRIIDGGGTAQLVAGRTELGAQLASIFKGPISLAKNPRGIEVVESALKAVAPTLSELKKIRITEGKILRRQAERLPGLLRQVITPISILGFAQGLRVASLVRALEVRDTALKQIRFTFYRLPDAKHQANLDAEVKAQLTRQQDGLNKLTVDTFIVRADTYKSDKFTRFDKLRDDAKRAVAAELKERAEAEATRAKKAQISLRNLIKQLQEKVKDAAKKIDEATQDLEQEKARTAEAAKRRKAAKEIREQAEEEKRATEQKIASVGADVAAERQTKKSAERATKLLKDLDPSDPQAAKEVLETEDVNRMTKRWDNLAKWRERHAEALAAIRDDQKFLREWEGMEIKERNFGYAVTHDPDQVVGGKGMLDLDAISVVEPPDASSSPQHKKEWKVYLEEVKKAIGAQYVNQRLGGFAGKGETREGWPKHYPALRGHAETQGRTPAAYGIWRMNTKLLPPIYEPPIKKGSK